MHSELKAKLRKEIVNNETVVALFSDNAEKLVQYANNTNNIDEEIACLEIIFDDLDENKTEVLFGSNWRIWLLGAYYDGGYISSDEAIKLSLKFLNVGVEEIVDDQYIEKVNSFIYCALISSKDPENIRIAKNLKSNSTLIPSIISKYETQNSNKKSGGCYVATCVYGSYDCPEVWTLRRFRDDILSENIFGRLFIKCYYAVSPTAVKLFGDYKWFHKLLKTPLDKLVNKLNSNGVENTQYYD